MPLKKTEIKIEDSSRGEAEKQSHYIMRLSLGLGVIPGIRPLVATGLPSTSWRSGENQWA